MYPTIIAEQEEWRNWGKKKMSAPSEDQLISLSLLNGTLIVHRGGGGGGVYAIHSIRK